MDESTPGRMERGQAGGQGPRLQKYERIRGESALSHQAPRSTNIMDVDGAGAARCKKEAPRKIDMIWGDASAHVHLPRRISRGEDEDGKEVGGGGMLHLWGLPQLDSRQSGWMGTPP